MKTNSDEFPFPAPSYLGVTIDASDYVFNLTAAHMLYLLSKYPEIEADLLFEKAHETYNLLKVKAMSLTKLWGMGLVKICGRKCSLTPTGKIVLEKVLSHEFWDASTWPPRK